MITLQKVLSELKAESLNEIVGGHGGSHKTGKSTKMTTKKAKKTTKRK
jgi:hypothetical protein